MSVRLHKAFSVPVFDFYVAWWGAGAWVGLRYDAVAGSVGRPTGGGLLWWNYE